MPIFKVISTNKSKVIREVYGVADIDGEPYFLIYFMKRWTWSPAYQYEPHII